MNSGFEKGIILNGLLPALHGEQIRSTGVSGCERSLSVEGRQTVDENDLWVFGQPGKK